MLHVFYNNECIPKYTIWFPLLGHKYKLVFIRIGPPAPDVFLYSLNPTISKQNYNQTYKLSIKFISTFINSRTGIQSSHVETIKKLHINYTKNFMKPY